MKNKIKKICSIFLVLLLILILIYNLSMIFQAVLKPNKTPSFFGIKSFVIVSGSMKPRLNLGDMVFVKEVTIEELNKNDIISFKDENSIVTHRIKDIEIVDGIKYFITKGDNNNTKDNCEVSINDIEGKLIFSIPLIGYISILLQNKYVLAGLLLIFLIYWFIKNKKEVMMNNENE